MIIPLIFIYGAYFAGHSFALRGRLHHTRVYRLHRYGLIILIKHTYIARSTTQNIVTIFRFITNRVSPDQKREIVRLVKTNEISIKLNIRTLLSNNYI